METLYYEFLAAFGNPLFYCTSGFANPLNQQELSLGTLGAFRKMDIITVENVSRSSFITNYPRNYEIEFKDHKSATEYTNLIL